MHRRRIVLILALAALALALLLPAVASALTYDQAVDNLYAKGYPQNVETYLNNLGTSDLGFRLGGTGADDTAADYLAEKLRAAGYTNVRLEAVPVDEWAVREASVTVGDTKFVCSQFAGVPGTDADGVTADVVYVGSGAAADYEGLEVSGKIVLVDSSMDNFWFNFQGAEATKHGAKAVILTSNYSDGAGMDFPSAPWYVIANDLANDHFSADELQGAGVSAAKTTALDKAITRFRKVSGKFGASKTAIDGVRGPASRNKAMLAAARKVLKGMTALDAWDYTAYPHEQTMWDNEYMMAALDALSADPVGPAAANEALTNVGLNWNGVVFSPSVYRYDLTRHDPDYSRIAWGKLGKLINYFDMTPVMAWIDDGKYEKAQASITNMLVANGSDLNKRVVNMTKALNGASDIMVKAI